MEMFADFNWLVLLIPLIAGFVGWFTNVVALKMTFHPVDFVGIPPYLGWRGVVPANAERLSQSLISLLTEKLLSVEELFSQSDEELTTEIDPVVDRVTAQVIEELSTNLAKEQWARAHQALRDYIEDLVRKSTRKVVLDILSDLKENAEEVIDLEAVVIDAVRNDAGLLGHVLTETAGNELKFIENSGFWFGLLFGLVQMAVWIVYPAWWVLPAGGFIVGYVTNFLALRLVFEPQEPMKIGPFTLQGVFIKRQQEVAVKFADLLADDVLNPDNMLQTVTQGPKSQRLRDIVEERVINLFEEYKRDPMAAVLIPPERMGDTRDDLLERLRTGKPEKNGLVQTFIGKTTSIRGQLTEKLQALDATSFESVLRPAFRADEWKLFVTGAVLGTGAGVLQLIYIFGGTLGS